MRPTALGVKAALFYLALVGAFFAAPYANHFFLLLTFLTVLGIFGTIWGAANVSGLHGGVEEVEAVPAGTSPPVVATVCGGWRTRFGICLELELEGDGTVVVPDGMVRGEKRILGRAEELPRGLYRVLSARATSSWPLGLIRFSRPLSAPEEIIVYPAPAQVTDVRGGAGVLDELCTPVGAPGGFMQPSSLREYRDGDELRDVHWKASARRNALVVQEWEGGTGAGAEVVLDRRCDPEVLERSLSILAAVAHAAREQKEALALHTQGLVATFGTNHRPWRELLRFLAAAQPLPADGAPPPPAPPHITRLPA